MFPYMNYLFFKNYYKHDDDKSCVKKQPISLSGKIHARTAICISVKKMKAFSKAKKCTINDIYLAFVSNAVKDYFDLKNDKNEHVSVNIPFSFKNIPRNIDEYTHGNCFSALTLYLKLVKGFDEAIESAKTLVTDQVK